MNGNADWGVISKKMAATFSTSSSDLSTGLVFRGVAKGGDGGDTSPPIIGGEGDGNSHHPPHVLGCHIIFLHDLF